MGVYLACVYWEYRDGILVSQDDFRKQFRYPDGLALPGFHNIIKMTEIKLKSNIPIQEALIYGCQELIDESFGKPNHYTWINGKVTELKEFVRMFGHIQGICEYAEDRLSELAKEFEDTKNSKSTYFTFAG